MICPKCNTSLWCPCNACADDKPESYAYWRWLPQVPDCISCGNCNFTAHADAWLDEIKIKEIK